MCHVKIYHKILRKSSCISSTVEGYGEKSDKVLHFLRATNRLKFHTRANCRILFFYVLYDIAGTLSLSSQTLLVTIVGASISSPCVGPFRS